MGDGGGWEDIEEEFLIFADLGFELLLLRADAVGHFVEDAAEFAEFVVGAEVDFDVGFAVAETSGACGEDAEWFCEETGEEEGDDGDGDADA